MTSESSSGKVYLKILKNFENLFDTPPPHKKSRSYPHGLCYKQAGEEEKQVDERLNTMRKTCQETQIMSFENSRWNFLELNVRPLYHKDKTYLLVQLTPIN